MGAQDVGTREKCKIKAISVFKHHSRGPLGGVEAMLTKWRDRY